MEVQQPLINAELSGAREEEVVVESDGRMQEEEEQQQESIIRSKFAFSKRTQLGPDTDPYLDQIMTPQNGFCL